MVVPFGVDVVASNSEALVEDGDEHVDEHIEDGRGVAKEEERAQEWAAHLQVEEVEPTQHHLDKIARRKWVMSFGTSYANCACARTSVVQCS